MCRSRQSLRVTAYERVYAVQDDSVCAIQKDGMNDGPFIVQDDGVCAIQEDGLCRSGAHSLPSLRRIALLRMKSYARCVRQPV